MEARKASGEVARGRRFPSPRERLGEQKGGSITMMHFLAPPGCRAHPGIKSRLRRPVVPDGRHRGPRAGRVVPAQRQAGLWWRRRAPLGRLGRRAIGDQGRRRWRRGAAAAAV
eukprot:8301345-Pyramimonas_sp.AAC.1